MKIEARVFEIIVVFCFFIAVVYAISTYLWGTDGVEPVGTVGLILTGGLALIAGSYFNFVARRLDRPRPEDNDTAEVSDGAGELGFFSPGSYWPVALAGAVAVTGIGTAFFEYWVILLGIGLLLFTIGGLVFEYHRGARAAGHGE